MTIQVIALEIPAMSTIGYGLGWDEEGEAVQFVGDHRPIRHLGEAVAQAASECELPTVELEDWQIINHGVSPSARTMARRADQ